MSNKLLEDRDEIIDFLAEEDYKKDSKKYGPGTIFRLIFLKKKDGTTRRVTLPFYLPKEEWIHERKKDRYDHRSLESLKKSYLGKLT